MRAGSWLVASRTGTVGDIHQLSSPTPEGRQVVRCQPTAPGLVLGSTQPDDIVDHEAAARRGTEVVRRRSGGGAVLLVPDEMLWLEVSISRNDGLWHDDVCRSSRWLGEVWVRALEKIGLAGAVASDRSACPPGVRRLVCFASVAPGELTVGAAKVVGISQRRTRDGAVFQCGALLRWKPRDLADLLVHPGLPTETLLVSIERAAVGVCDLLDPAGSGAARPLSAHGEGLGAARPPSAHGEGLGAARPLSGLDAHPVTDHSLLRGVAGGDRRHAERLWEEFLVELPD